MATDYDAALASDGKVEQQVVACSKRVRASGRKPILPPAAIFPTF
jgi:hypothetical protein